MSEKEFIEKMIEIMDTEEEVEMDSVLDTLEDWDSLSNVTFLTMCKSMNKDVTPDSILGAKTVRDLYQLLK